MVTKSSLKQEDAYSSTFRQSFGTCKMVFFEHRCVVTLQCVCGFSETSVCMPDGQMSPSPAQLGGSCTVRAGLPSTRLIIVTFLAQCWAVWSMLVRLNSVTLKSLSCQFVRLQHVSSEPYAITGRDRIFDSKKKKKVFIKNNSCG